MTVSEWNWTPKTPRVARNVCSLACGLRYSATAMEFRQWGGLLLRLALPSRPCVLPCPDFALPVRQTVLFCNKTRLHSLE